MRRHWEWYEPSIPRTVEDGLKARSKRGQFSETWWGKRWIEALEAFAGESRVRRGRSYARRGQVIDFQAEPGRVSAKVQGSRATPYRVKIALEPLPEEAWERAFQALAGQAAFAARLLAGELPPEIDAVFAEAGAALLPEAEEDLETDCSCPDWANPCKHVAAVHYLLAEELDRDPFLLFLLRGKDREAVLAALRRARGGEEDAAPEEEASEATAPLPVEGFWEVGPALAEWRVSLGPPAVPAAVLRRLGPPDFAEDAASLEARLRRVYDRVTERALETGLAEVDAAPEAEA